MTEYRRAHVPGASWFFTVNLTQRKGNHLLVDRIDSLRIAFETVRVRHPFRMDAAVILPEHWHCIMTLPEGDADFSTRWNLIMISIATRTTSTGIGPGTPGCVVSPIGRIRVSMNKCGAGFIPRIGVVERMRSKAWKDANDAVRASPHPTADWR